MMLLVSFKWALFVIIEFLQVQGAVNGPVLELSNPKGSTVEYANAVVPQQDAIVLKEENNNNNNNSHLANKWVLTYLGLCNRVIRYSILCTVFNVQQGKNWRGVCGGWTPTGKQITPTANAREKS